MGRGNKMECGTESYDYPSSIDTSLDYKAGKVLFSSQCAACHAIQTKVVGPPLSGVTERGPWKDRKVLYQYVRNPFSIKNNKYIDSLHKQYPIRHLFYPGLSDSLLSQLFLYINSERKRYNKPIP